MARSGGRSHRWQAGGAAGGSRVGTSSGALATREQMETAGMFFGEYQHALDAKGRVILPARFRERLNDGLVFVPGQDRCVDIYPLDEFERRVESMRTLPREDERGRAYRRVFNAGAHQDSLDGQGRVTVPPRLREYGALDRDLAVVGQDDHVEIWDRSAWETYRARAEREFAEVGTPFMFPSPA